MSQIPEPPRAPVVGIDWGTTNRRVYVLDERGELVRQYNDQVGIFSVAGGYRKSLEELLRLLALKRADIIMSGMVGSRNGWHEVPYLPVDRPLSHLPAAMVQIESGLPDVRCRIVPGYQYTDAHGMPDVMRGEETQVLGALAMCASTGWFLLPGTHSKWVRIEHGAIAEFATFMTGELYALLTRHGSLASLMQQEQQAPAAFEAGMTAARLGNFSHMAFCCRALVVTDMMPAEHASSYLSGLLLGAEVHEAWKRTREQTRPSVQLIGAPTLAARYLDALEFFGMSALVWQPDEVYVTALRILAGMRKLKQ